MQERVERRRRCQRPVDEMVCWQTFVEVQGSRKSATRRNEIEVRPLSVELPLLEQAQELQLGLQQQDHRTEDWPEHWRAPWPREKARSAIAVSANL